MGSRTNNRANAISVADAACVRLVRLIVKQIKALERNGVSAEGNRRFVERCVGAASDGVREQLKLEGTWI
jgi:hypothetical protein